jgi:hypothetical protein
MAEITAEKELVAGDGPYVVLLLGKDKDKKTAKFRVKLTVPENLRDTGDAVRDATCRKGYGRTAQECFGSAYARGEDIEALTREFPQKFPKLILGERKRKAAAGIKLDTIEQGALKRLVHFHFFKAAGLIGTADAEKAAAWKNGTNEAKAAAKAAALAEMQNNTKNWETALKKERAARSEEGFK